MNQTCRQCNTTFEITDQDRKFYQSFDVPAPELCPDCRLQRRMAWRNDRTFYVRKCDLSGQQFVSTYPSVTPFPVYQPSVWYGDQWDPTSYGQDIDFTRPFFEQWHDLMQKVPRLGIDIINCENSDYCNYCGDDKNCYLDIAGEANEDCYYNLFTKYSKNCVDCTFVYNSELCYEAVSCYHCHSVLYASYLDDCINCIFSYDLKSCHDCSFSTNLRHKSYYLFNKPYSQTDYQQAIEKLQLDTEQGWQAALQRYQKLLREQTIHRAAYIVNSEQCTGNDIKNCHNVEQAFNVTNCENSKYLYDVLDAKDCYDLNYSLYDPESSYELISTLNLRYSAFSQASHYCYNIFYCDQCNNSSDLFGCIGLNKKKYCIFNKQYSAVDYQQLKQKLIEHMKVTGEWGEFFPAQLSPFAYNETVAQEYMPLTKNDCLQRGWRWGESKVVDATFQKSSLLCTICNRYFKTIPQELRFYTQLHVPSPTICPNCRHSSRLQRRNPRRLWQRSCSNCQATIMSSYAPNRSEKVYCDQCYQREIY